MKGMPGKELRSLGYAFKGVCIAWREEINFRIDAAVAIVVIVASYLLHVSAGDFLIIVLLIGFVLTAEAFNTALEELCDKYSTDPDPHIAKIKDLSAGATLLAATTACVVGAFIFWPYIQQSF